MFFYLIHWIYTVFFLPEPCPQNGYHEWGEMYQSESWGPGRYTENWRCTLCGHRWDERWPDNQEDEAKELELVQSKRDP